MISADAYALGYVIVVHHRPQAVLELMAAIYSNDVTNLSNVEFGLILLGALRRLGRADQAARNRAGFLR